MSNEQKTFEEIKSFEQFKDYHAQSEYGFKDWNAMEKVFVVMDAFLDEAANHYAHYREELGYERGSELLTVNYEEGLKTGRKEGYEKGYQDGVDATKSIYKDLLKDLR